MAYTRQTWHDETRVQNLKLGAPDAGGYQEVKDVAFTGDGQTGEMVNAARLNYMESGIQSAAGVADTAQTTANSAQTTANAATKTVRFTATISATWTGSAAPYTQTVTVTGMLATDFPHIGPAASATAEQRAEWNKIGRIVAAANGITLTCYSDKPTLAIPVQMEVNR